MTLLVSLLKKLSWLVQVLDGARVSLLKEEVRASTVERTWLARCAAATAVTDFAKKCD